MDSDSSSANEISPNSGPVVQGSHSQEEPAVHPSDAFLQDPALFYNLQNFAFTTRQKTLLADFIFGHPALVGAYEKAQLPDKDGPEFAELREFYETLKREAQLDWSNSNSVPVEVVPQADKLLSYLRTFVEIPEAETLKLRDNFADLFPSVAAKIRDRQASLPLSLDEDDLNVLHNLRLCSQAKIAPEFLCLDIPPLPVGENSFEPNIFLALNASKSTFPLLAEFLRENAPQAMNVMFGWDLNDADAAIVREFLTDFKRQSQPQLTAAEHHSMASASASQPQASTTPEAEPAGFQGIPALQPPDQVPSRGGARPKVKDARRNKAIQKQLLKQSVEMKSEKAAASSDISEEVCGNSRPAATQDMGNERADLLIAHGGGVVDLCTPEIYLHKSWEFMEKYYSGWTVFQQASPIIPAICFSSAGHNEPRNPNVSVFVKPTDPSATRGQDFEERWYNFLNDFASARKLEIGSFPFFVLWRGEYSKFADKMPHDLAEHLGDLVKTYRQDEMVDFIVFIPSTCTILLIECKAEDPSRRNIGSRRGELKRKASKQLERCSTFIYRLFEYIILKIGQNGVRPKVVRLVAMDCCDAELQQNETEDSSVLHVGNNCLKSSSEWPNFLSQEIDDNLGRVSGTAKSEVKSPFLQLISVLCAQQNVVTGNVHTTMVSEICSQGYLKNPFKRQKDQRITKPEQFEDLHASFRSVVAKHLMYLSPKQAEALRDRRLFCDVLGPPGVGKTLILQLKAVQWCQEGHDVICTCSFAGLAEHFKNMLLDSLGFEDELVVDNSGNVLGNLLRQKPTDSSGCGRIIVGLTWKAVEQLFGQRTELGPMSGWRLIADEALPALSPMVGDLGPRQLRALRQVTSACWQVREFNNVSSTVPAMWPDSLQFDEVFRYSGQIFTRLKERIEAFQRPGVLLAHAVDGCKVLACRHANTFPSTLTLVLLQQLVQFDLAENLRIVEFLKYWINEVVGAVCLCSSGLQAEPHYDYRKLAILTDMSNKTGTATLEVIKEACAQLHVPVKSAQAKQSENAVVIANSEFIGLEYEAVICLDMHIGHEFEQYMDDAAHYGSHRRRLSFYKESRAVATLCPLSILLIPLPDDLTSLNCDENARFIFISEK